MLLIFPFSVVSLRKNTAPVSLNFFLKRLLVNLTTYLKQMFFFSKDLSADLFSAASFPAGVAKKSSRSAVLWQKQQGKVDKQVITWLIRIRRNIHSYIL